MKALLRSAVGLAATLGTTGMASAASCNVTPQSVSFGNYDTIGGPTVDGVGSVNVACDGPVDFVVTLSAGSGPFNDRHMLSGAAQLGYNLYTNSSRTVVWADGILGSSILASGTNVDLTIYGRIAAGQNVPAGFYNDTITISVTY